MQADFIELLYDIHCLERAFQLNRESFGEKLWQITRDRIITHCRYQIDPEANPWEQLSDEYQQWKDIVAPGQPIGKLWEHMLQPEQMDGIRHTTEDEMTITYGLDAKARAEAEQFQEGGTVTGTRQPARPFYAIPVTAEDLIDRMVEDHFLNHLEIS